MEKEGNKITAHARDASFSSYLTGAEGSLDCKFPALNLSRRIIDQDGEISVFGAERYFGMMLEDDIPRVLVDYNNTGRAGLQQQKQVKTSSRPGTPSTFPDASWDSRTMFSPSLRRSQYLNKKNNLKGKKMFSGFVCNGSCSDQKSIHVRSVNIRVAGDFKKQSFGMDHHDHVKKSQPRYKGKEDDVFNQYPSFGGSNKEERLVFAKFAAEEQKKAKEEEQELRKSLELFGSEVIMKKGEDIVAKNLEMRLSLLSWDAIPKPQQQSSTSANDEMNGDNDSVASSDLFEIEYLTGTGQPLMFTKQASDQVFSMASSTKYKSSETSADSRVVTANVTSTAVSDNNEKKLAPANQLQHQSLKSAMAAETCENFLTVCSK